MASAVVMPSPVSFAAEAASITGDDEPEQAVSAKSPRTGAYSQLK